LITIYLKNNNLTIEDVLLPTVDDKYASHF
jgi:hypothetical protein